jgi:hypothetical protein
VRGVGGRGWRKKTVREAEVDERGKAMRTASLRMSLSWIRGGWSELKHVSGWNLRDSNPGNIW